MSQTVETRQERVARLVGDFESNPHITLRTILAQCHDEREQDELMREIGAAITLEQYHQDQLALAVPQVSINPKAILLAAIQVEQGIRRSQRTLSFAS